MTTTRVSEESQKLKSGNTIKAGLLWLLLKGQRSRVASYLSNDEISSLNKGASSFLAASKSVQLQATRSLQKALMPAGRGPLWVLTAVLLTLTGFGFGLYIAIHSHRSFLDAIVLFGPLFIGCASPASFELIARYRLPVLFSWQSFQVGFLYAVPGFVSLVWLLFLINTETQLPYSRLPVFEMSVLVAGAMLAPVLEEVVFRELIPTAVGVSPHFLGHLCAALLFTVLHLPASVDQFVYYFLAASTLSLLRILSGGLIWPIVVHSLANLTILLVL